MVATTNASDPADDATCTEKDAAYYRDVLHELIEIGSGFARLVFQGAEIAAEHQTADAAPLGDAVVAFERVSRSIRRSILLAQRLNEPAPPRSDRQATRRRIIREVEDVIARDAEVDQAESLHAEFSERLDGPEMDNDIGDRPVGEIVADICRDLGLGNPLGSHPWKRRTPADITWLHARAAQNAMTTSGSVMAERNAAAGRIIRRDASMIRVGLLSKDGCRGP